MAISADFASPDVYADPAAERLDTSANVVTLVRAVASVARLTLHLDLQAGTNAHHMIEACFKAFARALQTAVTQDPTEQGIPSTKGTLT